MLEYTCLQQTSIVFESFGTILMLFVCTRGIDTAARPSLFFYEAVLARILLVIGWSVSHFLMSFFDTDDLGTDLLKANITLDLLHTAVHCVQLYFHRYWCVTEGWYRLRQRNALQHIEIILRYGCLSAAIASMLGNIFLFHTVDQPPYMANLLIQFIFAFQPTIILYRLRQRMFEGHILLIFVWITCSASVCLTVGLLVMHFCYGTPLGFDDRFGYLGQVVLWVFFSICAAVWYFDSSSARLHSGPGCADPTPIEDEPKLIQLRSLEAVVPSVKSVSTGSASSVSSADPNRMFELIPGSVQSSSGSSMESSFLESQGNSKHFGPNIDSTSERQVPPCAHVSKPASVHFGEHVLHVLEATSMPFVPPLPISVHHHSPANPVLMQMHRGILCLGEFLLFGGLILIFDAVVAVAYPSLPRCSQSDPFGNEASGALRSLFDLFT
jgi:hypothetical protein